MKLLWIIKLKCFKWFECQIGCNYPSNIHLPTRHILRRIPSPLLIVLISQLSLADIQLYYISAMKIKPDSLIIHNLSYNVSLCKNNQSNPLSIQLFKLKNVCRPEILYSCDFAAEKFHEQLSKALIRFFNCGLLIG